MHPKLQKIVTFENAKRVCKLGYNKPTRYFYFIDGSIDQAYAIDISSEMLWWVPSFDNIAEWLKDTYGLGIGMSPSMWDIELGKEIDESKLTWFFRCPTLDIVQDDKTYMDAFNKGLSRVLDKIEENGKETIRKITGYTESQS